MSDIDRWTTLALSQLTYNAGWMLSHLSSVETAVTNLPYRRNYTTDAEAGLEELEDKLMDMLSRVRSVLREYEAKPIYVKSPDVDLREDCRMLSLDAAE